MRQVHLKFNYRFAYRSKEKGAPDEFEAWQKVDRIIESEVPERSAREEFVLKLLLADQDLKPKSKWTKFEFASYLAIPTKRERPAEAELEANTAPA